MKLFTVGPVEMHDETLLLGRKQIPYFRNEWFSHIMLELDGNLKKAINMSENDKNIILTCSGTGAMEATVLNCLSREDKVLIIVGGSFGYRFTQLCDIYNIEYDILEVPFEESLDERLLDKYDSKGYTALLVNIGETSIGKLYPIDVLSNFCVKNNMIFIVDAISSIFADEIDFNKNNIDALIFSSQKALALAPGIAAVSLSERMCKKRIYNRKSRSLYFDFNSYIINGVRGQTPFTPAVGIIIQMNEMIKKILEMGIDKKIKKTSELAKDFRKKITAAGFDIPKYFLSNALTPIIFEKGAKLYYERLIKDFEITVNPCGGEMADKMIRVGHMGNLDFTDNDLLVSALCRIKENVE